MSYTGFRDPVPSGAYPLFWTVTTPSLQDSPSPTRTRDWGGQEVVWAHVWARSDTSLSRTDELVGTCVTPSRGTGVTLSQDVGPVVLLFCLWLFRGSRGTTAKSFWVRDVRGRKPDVRRAGWVLRTCLKLSWIKSDFLRFLTSCKVIGVLDPKPASATLCRPYPRTPGRRTESWQSLIEETGRGTPVFHPRPQRPPTVLGGRGLRPRDSHPTKTTSTFLRPPLEDRRHLLSTTRTGNFSRRYKGSPDPWPRGLRDRDHTSGQKGRESSVSPSTSDSSERHQWSL